MFERCQVCLPMEHMYPYVHVHTNVYTYADFYVWVHFLFQNISAGTPKYDGNFNAIIEQARHEANLYKKCNIVSELPSIFTFTGERKKAAPL